jgi:hypothetical protein
MHNNLTHKIDWEIFILAQTSQGTNTNSCKKNQHQIQTIKLWINMLQPILPTSSEVIDFNLMLS